VSYDGPILPLPSGYPEVLAYPNVARLLDVQVDMQFGDLASMLQLPIDELGLTGGCNLAATLAACSVISGASTLFYEASMDSVRGQRSSTNTLSSGERFRRVVRDYFPWQGDEATTPAQTARLLYKHLRNPLVHTLGVGKAGATFPGLGGDTILLRKGAMPAAWVAELLAGEPTRPEFLGRLIAQEDEALVIDVGTLVWGVAVLLRRLLGDGTQIPAAEELARRLRGTI
jgi:hypothetical protein